MKNIILLAIILSGIKLFAFHQPTKNMNLDKPATVFDSNMVITLYNGGGMNYESTTIEFRFDSIVYTKMDHGKDFITRIEMTPELRQKVINIIDDHRFYSLKSEPCELINDKATSSICIRIGRGPSTCVMSGATEMVAEKDRADFHSIWTKLEALTKMEE